MSGTGISFDEFDPESVGGIDKVAAGSYHLQVVAVDPEGGKKGAMVVDFEVLGGTTPNQEGKVHQERFGTDLKKIIQKKRAAFAIATGIITMEMAKQAKAEKRDLEPNWEDAVGKQVCMNIVESEDGKYTNMNWDEIWHPADKKANHVPLNPGMIKRAGITLPADRPIGGTPKAAAVSSSQSSPASGSAAKSVAPPASVDNLLAGVV